MKEENEESKNFMNLSDDDQEFNSIDQYLKSVQLEQPSVNFTQKVMNNLHQTSGVIFALPSRNKILMLAGILVAIGVAVLMIAGGAFNQVTTISVDQNVIQNEQIREYVPSIPFNGELIINIVILMNLALVFIILDRAILKPWFNRRAKANY